MFIWDLSSGSCSRKEKTTDYQNKTNQVEYYLSLLHQCVDDAKVKETHKRYEFMRFGWRKLRTKRKRTNPKRDPFFDAHRICLRKYLVLNSTRWCMWFGLVIAANVCLCVLVWRAFGSSCITWCIKKILEQPTPPLGRLFSVCVCLVSLDRQCFFSTKFSDFVLIFSFSFLSLSLRVSVFFLDFRPFNI